jgi:hypothetical protein
LDLTLPLDEEDEALLCIKAMLVDVVIIDARYGMWMWTF